jgi:hypothetical protein
MDGVNTFLPYPDAEASARVLDDKRLGKQRVETIQILNILLGFAEGGGWHHHPAVRMWRGYEPYLHRKYLRATLDEWGRRDFRNELCESHYERLAVRLRGRKAFAPRWFDAAFHRSHQSNLVRKAPGHYRPHFPDVPDDLPYIWPVR